MKQGKLVRVSCLPSRPVLATRTLLRPAKNGTRSLITRSHCPVLLASNCFPSTSRLERRYRAFSSVSPISDAAPRSEDIELLAKIGNAVGVKEMIDWYRVSRTSFLQQEGGEALLKRYPSIEEALRTNYPDFSWESQEFLDTTRIPHGYYTDLQRQRELVERIGRDLGVKQLEDWYRVSFSRASKLGGWRVLRTYKSLEALLQAIYPGFPWEPERFQAEGKAKMKSGYWKDKNNLLAALSRAEAKLNINQPEDWYTVTLADLKNIGFSSKITKPVLAELLEEKYPNYQWEKLYLLKGRFAQQKRLEKAVTSLFPFTTVKTNVRKEADLINPVTKEYLELDVYLPELRLAFEYQEKHHYTSSDYTYKPLNTIQERDKAKLDLAATKGITLIAVPCWWDGTSESLIATIKKRRTDLLKDVSATANPIPEEMPPTFIDKNTSTVEDIGEPVSACFFTMSNVNPVNWWMFEKYDGLRGFWNPIKKAFFSRGGNQFRFPPEVIDSMPQDMFLDGELWFGRDNFSESMKISTRAKWSQIDWSKFKYMVFDVPNHAGTYEERFNLLQDKVGSGKWKYIETARWEKCKGITHLEEFFQSVVDEGGEGVILRDPNARDQHGRSPGYLKHKKFRDAEAKVVGKAGNQQWECELPNGVRFVAAAGTTEFVKRWDPQPGDIVSFKHHGFLLASKRPKFPTIYRMRTDLKWQDVLDNWKENKSEPSALPLRRPETRNKPKGYWMEHENIRNFFCEFAAEAGFDPMVPENWKDVNIQQVIAKKGVGPLWKYNYSLKAGLEAAFAQDNFKHPVMRFQDRHWDDVNNCRQFFDEFAKEQGFDPLDTESWYSINLRDMLEKKGGVTLKKRHGGWKKALQSAYPELQFTKWD